MGIAEEGLEAQGLVKPVVLGELVSVVEADGFAYRLWEFAELTSDGPGGEDSFSINRVLDDAEAGLSFVENEQKSASQWPGVPRLSTSAGRSGDRTPLFDEAGGAASWTVPSSSFAARQQAMPAILLSRTMIDETID